MGRLRVLGQVENSEVAEVQRGRRCRLHIRLILQLLQIRVAHRLTLQINKKRTEHHLLHFCLDLLVVLLAQGLEDLGRVGIAFAHGSFEVEPLRLRIKLTILIEHAALALLIDYKFDILVGHLGNHFHVRIFELRVKVSDLLFKKWREVVIVQDFGHLMTIFQNLVLEVNHSVAVDKNESLVDRVRDDRLKRAHFLEGCLFDVESKFVEVLGCVPEGGGAGVVGVHLPRLHAHENPKQLLDKLAPVLLLAVSRLPIKDAPLDQISQHLQRAALRLVRLGPIVSIMFLVRVLPHDNLPFIVLHRKEHLFGQSVKQVYIILGNVVDVGDDELFVRAGEFVVVLDLLIDILENIRVPHEPLFVIGFGGSDGAVEQRVFECRAEFTVVIVVHAISGDLSHDGGR